MKKYSFSFYGRQKGAIGISYQIKQDYMANSLAEACTMLWIDYEPSRNTTLNGKEFKFESQHLDHKETKETYKGLGKARK